jgi:hypothetical protein
MYVLVYTENCWMEKLRVKSHEVIITSYQRTLLGMSANQKRHYLKSYNKYSYWWFTFDIIDTEIFKIHVCTGIH